MIAAMISRLGWIMLGGACATSAMAAGLNGKNLPDNFMEQMVQQTPAWRMTLPNGQQVLGSLTRNERMSGLLVDLEGELQHPQAGHFKFHRVPRDGMPDLVTGELRFAGQPTRWTVEAIPRSPGFCLVEGPAEGAAPATPPAIPAAPVSRDEAEASLRKDLKIEQIAPGKLRIGLVQLDQAARTLRIQANVNMVQGPIEYALVSDSGKCHESLLSTKAAARDIHLAMLLLGVRPSRCVESADKSLQVPGDAAISIRAEWETNGPTTAYDLGTLVAIASESPDQVTRKTLPTQAWLYNGSRFNGAGFGASIEGSIISLIGDELALINGTGVDRARDDIHVPNAKLLPPVGAPVTVVMVAPPAKPARSVP